MKKLSFFLLLCLFLFVLIMFFLLNYDHLRNNQLIYIRREDCASLDPARAQDYLSAEVILNIYEGLVKFKPGTIEIEPSLANSWEVSEDGLMWTFKLRPGVFFQDGTVCNAGAVKFSFDRQLKEDANNTISYASVIFGMVSSVEAIDDLTVRFILKYPYAPFLNNLALPFSAPIVSPSAVKEYGNDFWQHPVGTGPFKVRQWKHGSEVVLNANEGYWGKKPMISEIIFRKEDNPDRRLKMLQAGKADIVEGLPSADFSALAEKGIKIQSAGGMDISYLGFYTNKKPFNTLQARKAVCQSINLEELTKTLYGSNIVPANGPLPPGVLAFQKNLKQYPYDPEQARLQLKAAGYPDGLKITLISYADSRPYNPAGGAKLASAVAEQLKKAGIQTQVITYPWEEFKQALSRQEGDAFIYGWTSDNGDPDNFLYTLFCWAQYNRSQNSTRYENQKVDTLLITAQRTSDPALRAMLYHDVQEQLLSDAPALFINHSLNIAFTRPEIENFTLQPWGISYLSSVKKQLKNRI